MNTKLDFIFKRRSIRNYQEKEIPEDVVDDVLKAGMAAPSAVAKDPWRFIVERDSKLLESISEGLPNGKMLAKANVGLVVCGDIDVTHGNEMSYMLQDCSAAIENILLAANALGLGACWLGVHPREERIAYIRELLEIPENVIPIAVISLGYPKEEKEARTRYNNDYIHYGKWQKK